jgi:hypothetical protein
MTSPKPCDILTIETGKETGIKNKILENLEQSQQRNPSTTPVHQKPRRLVNNRLSKNDQCVKKLVSWTVSGSSLSK